MKKRNVVGGLHQNPVGIAEMHTGAKATRATRRAFVGSSKLISGFTLIELLVVIAVLAVVTSIGIRAFIAVSSGWSTQETRLALNAKAVAVLDEFQNHFALTVSSRLGGIAIVGETRTEENKRYGRVSLEDDRITVPIQLKPLADAPGERINATYSIDRASAVPRLVRGEARIGAGQGDETVFEVAKGVMAIRFEYFDGKAWLRGWNQPGHPEAVRVGLVVQDEDRPHEQMARTAVFPIRVD